MTLLEEPQAALYAWIAARGDAWRKDVHPGDVILVVDVGGGTTDFSAIAATEQGGTLELVRVAVGDHIPCSAGDNLDLALAHLVKQKLEAAGKEVDRVQMHALVYACRAAQERLRGGVPPDTSPSASAGRRAPLVGGGLGSGIPREVAGRVVVEGFFPLVESWTARPAVRARAALTQIGLPYASDAAVTKHLAAFLTKHARALDKLPGFAPKAGGDGAEHRAPKILRPTAVLFNGGVMKAPALAKRVTEALARWLEADGAKPPRILEGADLDLGVAARRRVRTLRAARPGPAHPRRHAARARTTSASRAPSPAVPGVEAADHRGFLCVAPFGMEEGTEAPLPPNSRARRRRRRAGALPSFFGSTVRRDDQARHQALEEMEKTGARGASRPSR